MSGSSEHRAWRELLGVLALGRLAQEEALGVQAHVDGCAACRAELAELTATAGLLTGVDPDRLDEDVPVPPELAGRVLAAVRSERATVVELAPRRRVPRWVPAAAAAVLVAVVAGGVGYGLAPEPPARPLEAVALTEPGGGALDVTAAVVPHTWGMEIALTGRGFTPGEDYRVTVLTDSGGRAQAGEFVGVGEAEMRCSLSSAVLRTDAEGFEVLDSAGRVVLASVF